MLALAAVSFVAGIVFVTMGAWPVTGFFGLDVLLLYYAFRVNYRQARRGEVIRLAGDALTIERASVRGAPRIWRFHPYWARLHLVEAETGENRLFLVSHGRSLAIGTFLGPGERRRLARDLQAALDRYRMPEFPN
ncbi:MAG: DUF2244 domain-containing protein [Hyphomicrobiales bacterium]|nr:DUF2244 domain-containing protein [Hyphomicrobiales bacterium]